MKKLSEMSFTDLLAWYKWTKKKCDYYGGTSELGKKHPKEAQFWGKAHTKVDDEIHARETDLFGNPYND